MSSDMIEKQVMKLDNIVVVRHIPQTEEGSNNLRKARKYLVDQIKRASGQDVELPFPVVMHMVLEDFVRSKSLKDK